MSFGFPSLTEDLECIRSAILHAHAQNVVLFAAARNSGGLQRVAYPAAQSEVICVRSSDGHGNASLFNPSTEGGSEIEFSVVGEAVLSSWAGGPARRMSGTSFATPVAAGIAAIVMDYLAQKSRTWDAGDAQYVAKRIRSKRGVEEVFLKHLSTKRGDFNFLCPWRFFNLEGERELDGVLLNTLRSL